jgi:hypothetical protein
MRRSVLIAFSFFALFTASAQEVANTKSPAAWKTGGMLTIMAGQSGTRNWAPTGSEKFTLSVGANLTLWATKKSGKNSWDNTADLSYAFINTHSTGTRKIDDKIDLYFKYGHSVGKTTAIGIVTNLRSQFTNGYDYTETPKKRVSGFFAPAYLTFSPGFQFSTLHQSLSFHVGVDARAIIVTNSPYSLVYQGGVKPDGSQERTLADLYGVDPALQVRYEIGPFVSALFKKEVMKNVLWKSRVDLHADVLHEHPEDVDIYWTNTITMSVNKWLKVNYKFDLYQDSDVKMFGPAKNESRTQMISLLGVGLGVSF